MVDTPTLTLLIPALIAGFVTFFAPCTLPLVPAYLALLAGVAEEDFQDPQKSRRARRRMFINGLAFVAGFTIVFVLLGTLVGVLGSQVAVARETMQKVGGVLVILFGLFLLGAVRIRFLEREFKFRAPRWFHPGTSPAAFVTGSAFALGWSPCIGPILGSILLVASSEGTGLSGAMLLTMFSLGLAVPFLLITLVFTTASRFIGRINRYLRVASVVGGVFLIMLGILLITGDSSLLIGYLYDLLTKLDYEQTLSPLL